MTIRNKLVSLMLGILLLVLAGVLVFGVVIRPVYIMERERAVLTTLSASLRDLLIEANYLTHAKFTLRFPAFREALEKVDGDFTVIRNLRLLPKANARIAEALEVIFRLRELHDRHVQNLLTGTESLIEDARAVFGFPEQITVTRFYADRRAAEHAEIVRVREDIQSWYSTVTMLTDSVTSSISVIEEQADLIDAEIRAIWRRSFIISAGIGALILFLIGISSKLVSRTIVRSVRSIERNIAHMKDGDLRNRFREESRDEIGGLSGNLNIFLASLKAALLEIQKASAENVTVRDELLQAIAATSTSSRQIESHADDIRGQTRYLDEAATEAAEATDLIAGHIASLTERIGNQMVMVEEASAAVTEMMTSVSSVARLSENNRTAAEGLVEVTTGGGEKFRATFRGIKEIHESINGINNMAAIIEDIAARTNLLAMNAAIEAAHAGDKGKGFGVVAQEIRKLAEASSRNSQEISQTLERIVGRIEDASAASEETLDAFRKIEEEIRNTSNSFLSIFSSMTELGDGGRQIIAAMTSLQDISSDINHDAEEMHGNSETLVSTVKSVQTVSEKARIGIEEITEGLAEITRATERTATVSERIRAIGDRLDRESRHFLV